MRDPRTLIDTATLAASLAASLGDASLRVFDCTTYLEPTPAGSTEPYIAVPGRKTFEDGHVPGARARPDTAADRAADDDAHRQPGNAA